MVRVDLGKYRARHRHPPTNHYVQKKYLLGLIKFDQDIGEEKDTEADEDVEASPVVDQFDQLATARIV